MHTLLTGKRPAKLRVILFGMTLVFGALFFIACPPETGIGPGDFDDSGGYDDSGDGYTNDGLPLTGPRSIQVTVKDKSLVLQWTKIAPAQGVTPTYEVWYGTLDSKTATTTKKWEDVQPNDSKLVTSTITGLTNEIPYYVWVKAIYTDLGKSKFSPTETGIPIPPPVTPGTLTVTSGEAMLDITWTAVPHAFTYEVYYNAGGTGSVPPADTLEAMKTVSDPGIVLPGLSNSTNYTIWVRALNTAGNSPAYATGAGTPVLSAVAPATAPGKLSLVAGDTKLTLTWSQVPGVPYYKLYYNTTDDSSTVTAVTGTVPANAPTVSAEITGLTNGTPYYVWVTSANSQGESLKSASATGTPIAKDPIVFTNLKFELGKAAAEYIFAVDLPPSVFFPEGRPNTDRLTRVQETALGNLFTDGVAWYVRNKLHEPIDFVFLNGGYIDNVLPKGAITVGSISGVTQPDSRQDKIFLLSMTGAELKLFFEDMAGKESAFEPGDVSGVVHTGRGGPHNTGFFGVVSKEVRYTLQYYKPPAGTSPEISSADAEPYYHGFIKSGTLKINGADIVDTQTYRICTTDYLAAGEYFTGLYTAWKDESGNTKPAGNPKPTTIPFWHGVAEYIYDQGTVTPYLDGRIKIEGGVPLPPPWTEGTLVKPNP